MREPRKLKTIPVETRILNENDRLAAENRAWFNQQGIFVDQLDQFAGLRQNQFAGRDPESPEGSK